MCRNVWKCVGNCAAGAIYRCLWCGTPRRVGTELGSSQAYWDGAREVSKVIELPKLLRQIL
eukprot:2265232-Heterocapsa_arctica.AAC.1